MNSHEFADVELFLRPANEYKNGEHEQVLQASYEEMARRTTHSLIESAGDHFVITHPGEWKVGIRERGDEQYFQRFAVVEPHAEKRGEWEVQNHISGVLNHWRW